MSYNRTLVLILLSCIILKASAQNNGETSDPKVGTQFPNYIFNNVHNSSEKSVATSQFKGKWLILDFWSESCSGCIGSFPLVNALQHRFQTDVKFIMVGYDGSRYTERNEPSGVAMLGDRLTKSLNLQLAMAYDSTLYNLYEISGVGCPYVVVIDPKGEIRFLTTHLSEKNISDILAGRDVKLDPIERVFGRGFNFIPHQKNNDTNMLYQDCISNWLPEADNFQIRPNLDSDTSTSNWFEILGMQLDYLYRFAYTGYTDWDNPNYIYYSTFKYYPVLQMGDSSDFRSDKKYSFEFKSLKKLSKAEIMKKLQQNLSQCFGYRASIEYRKFQYWSIYLKDSGVQSHLITKGDSTSFRAINGNKFLGFSATNVPFSTIIGVLFSNFQLHVSGLGSGLPFVDESGLNKNIDITINAVLSNFDEFRKALALQGVQLGIKEKIMPCIVISSN
jgi:thiol-disulfide isomerase/thioredoxin